MSDSATAIRRLREAFEPEQLVTDADGLALRSHDRSHHEWQLARAAVLCRSTDDVSRALTICNETRTPVVARGTGTGLEGGANLTAESICIDVSGLDRILRVDPASLDATVEAGVTRSRLNPVVAEHGLYFPVGPGVDACIGGMAATRASGTNAVRYGTMRESVLGLKVVLADGSVVDTGGRVRKSSAGYDLTRLFIGSEGTLGIITEVTVRLHAIPQAVALAVWSFPDVVSAARLVERTLGADIPIARAELLDDVMVRAMNRFSGLGWAETATLLLEFSGGPAAVREQQDFVTEIARELRGVVAVEPDTNEARDRVWRARHDALPAAAALVPGAQTWSTDVCVPVSRLAECIGATQHDVEASGLLAPIAGHVGDGNFHLAFVLPPGDTRAREKAGRVNERLVERALAMEGTCTGEHGVGTGKIGSVAREHPTGVPVMRLIRQALDPHGIMNPGKVIT